MGGKSDLYVLILIIIVLIIWALYGMRNAMERRFPIHQLPNIDKAGPPTGDAVSILEDEGYDVLCGKWRIPMGIKVNKKKLQTRLYVDYLVKDPDGLYIVKCARQRQHIEWTGTGVRDYFLPYLAIHHRIIGILYLNMDSHKITKIQVDWDGME